VLEQIVRGPLLVPQPNGAMVFYPDGVLAADGDGVLQLAGDWRAQNLSAHPWRGSDGVMLPPLLDIHIHVPQHPIRGRFTEGVDDDAPGGKLLAGLRRNVFPAEASCDAREVAEQVTRAFLADTLAHGVVGGAAYITPSPLATEVALEILPDTWSVGLVLMNQNCPANLRTREASLDDDVARLASRYGRRLIITDRFAVAVDSPLRRRGVTLAQRHGLRTQTHLNEQTYEKNFVENDLYPRADSYAGVYHQDGLLDHDCILAHCIHMTDDEWRILRDTGSSIAHCPTSNQHLGSGRMNLDHVIRYGIPWALATDVGASATVSMLAEMARFVRVHHGHSSQAIPAEALYRSTLAPATILGLDLGRLEPGRPMSFIEVAAQPAPDAAADDVIQSLLPDDLEQPRSRVARVTLRGRVVQQGGHTDA
jgi:guanine deaminase